mgnify:CR=1 FL=1
MQIQPTTSSTSNMFKIVKNDEAEEHPLFHLRLDEESNKSQKPRFEIRHEGGYIRKYVIKANGDKVLIMETKQQVNADGAAGNESGNLVEQAYDGLMKQLELFANHEKKQHKVISTWEKESGITKYKTGI